jgi:acyl transferase domain-containing protein/thioesterase domain-containing protein/aryl carrier-like protein
MTDVADNALSTDIAVVGMACRVPGARDAEAFWRNLRDGVESIRALDEDELREAGVAPALLADPRYVRRGAPLADMECFDAGFFGMSPHEAAIMDPQHRHFLETAWEALEHAGHVPSRFQKPIGVFAGSGHNAYLSYNLLTRPELLENDGFFLLRHTGNDKDFLTTRVSYVFDLQGPSVAVQTACSTSLVAVHMAVQSLLAGECDMALAGGVTIEMPHRQGYLYAEGEILSPDGRCRPFDAKAEGTVFGSGAGAVVLRRLGDAIADGDSIYAIVKGTAVNNDGSKKVSYLAPSVEGQAGAVTEALAVAGVDAGSIGFIAAHGTGTPVGDPIEVAALTEAFRHHTERKGYCAIGSVKANVGHLDTAAGVASLIAAIQALRHRQIPPSLHFESPNPACRFEETPFSLSARLREWPASGARRAGVSSLGVGGTNAHVILEEAGPAAQTPDAGSRQLLVLSARTPTALDRATDRLGAALAAPDAPALADAAWTLQEGREAMRHRRVVVACATSDASAALASRDAQRVFSGEAPDRARSVAFLFAGGGSQYPGMGSGLYHEEPAYRDAVDACLSTLAPAHAAELRPLLLLAGADAAAARAMERPTLGLPALFITQYAQARLWSVRGIEPSALIGHSMGEYTAACLAGVFSVKDALALVVKRAQLFEAVEEGAMLSVPLPAAELLGLLESSVSIAAVNAPTLAVASGPVEAIERLKRRLAERGVDSSRLRINVAAHSVLLEPVLAEFRAFVRGLELSPPMLPIASNLSGSWLTDAEATDPEYWVRHLRQTVRFADGVKLLAGDGSRVLLEVGPGRTLSSLARQQGSTPVVALASMRHPDEPFADGDVMLTAIGRLWAAGVEVEWTRLHDAPRRRVALPTYPFERERHWIEARPVTTSSGASTILHRTGDVADWFAQPSWRRAAPSPALAFDGPVLIFTDRSPMAKALLERLRAASIDVFTARRGTRYQQVGPDTYSLTPGSTDDAARLLATLRDAGRLPKRIVFAWPLEDTSLETGLFSLLALVQALGAEEVNVDLLVLTAGAVRVSGESNLEPRLGTLVGAVPVIPAELPGVRARLVDIGNDRTPAGRFIEHLAAELAADGPDIVALRGPDRWIPTVEPLHLEAPLAPAFRERGVYLITGAFGGLGLAVARHLAIAYQARLVLVGRHALPRPGDWDRWLQQHGNEDETSRRIQLVRELEGLGAEVLPISVDVTDAPALRRGIDETRRRFGALHGVLHAAGVLDDGALQVRDIAATRRVLAPKVQGTLALHEALRGTSPDFVVLFSSISAFAGLPGQFDYAAANAFLDAWAQSQADVIGPRVVTINWAPWSDVGMAATLAGAIGVGTRHGEPTGHPVLSRRVTLRAREHAFTGVLSPETDWMLSEHRVRGGEPLLPGTGSLSLVHLAERLAGRDGALALREVEFVDALIVPTGTKCEIRVRLDAAGGHFALESRRDASAPWRLHVRGRTGVPSGLAAPVDLLSLRARCTQTVDPATVTSEAPLLEFGPRWHNVAGIRVGQREALIDLALDRRFAGDLAAFPLHPALLDLGLAGAQAIVPWLERDTQLLVPLSIGTLKVYAPLEREIASRVRYREDLSTPGDVAVFDVAMCDVAGRVLVEVGEFHMLAMRDQSKLAASSARPTQERGASPPPANPLLSLTLREGIRTDEGILALERVLAAGNLTQVGVSPLPLDALLRQLRASTRAALPAVAADGRRTTELQNGESLTPLQTEMVGFLGSVLAMPEIRLDENLIDLGLHSLLAVRLFTRLKKLTGLNLPLSTLLEAPTVRLLSERFGDRAGIPAVVGSRVPTPLPGPADIVSSSDAVRDPRAHAHWLRPVYSYVVPLKPTGILPPFFTIHARGGAVLNYRTLSSFVDPEQPVYGIQCRGLDGRTEPFRTLEEMAAQYIDEIRRVQPHGPYFLGGGSLGGIVALEMAQQLRRTGERIGLLAMFDSWGPMWFSPEHRPSARSRLWRRIMNHVNRIRRGGLSLEVRLLRANGRERFRDVHHLRMAQLLRMLNIELPHSIRYTYVEYANLAALRRYAPKPYDESVVLFRALDDPDADFSDPTMGWKVTVNGGIEVIDAPGTHNSMVHDPAFGEIFRLRLRQAQHDVTTVPIEPGLNRTEV